MNACTADAQIELNLKPAPAADPCVVEFVRILEQQTVWLTANQLLPILGLAITESNKRHLRQWAESSGGKILSGQQGYLHIRHATAEEAQHAAAWLEHQANKMGLRAREIRHCYHQQLHQPRSQNLKSEISNLK